MLYMDKENDGSSDLEQEIVIKGEIQTVIDGWARSLQLSKEDEARQFLNKANLFNEDKIDRLYPECDISFWIKYGVRYWEELEGEVLEKTGVTLTRDRIKISSVMAREAAKKVEGGEDIKNLSRSEKISMLALAKAKILAVEKTALDIYPGLRNEFEVSKKEIDVAMSTLLANGDKATDINNDFNWDRFISTGKMRLPVFITVASLVLAAASGGISAVNASAENKNVRSESALTFVDTVAFDQALLEDRMATSVPEAMVLSPEEQQSQTYLYDTKYGEEIYIYNEPWIQEKLANFKEEYGISIVNPWNSIDSNTGEMSLSIQWSPSEVAVLIDEISKLPPEYLDRNYQFFPKAIILFKTVDSHGTAGGSAGGTDITFFIPADFDLNKQEEGSIGLIFGTSERHLRSTIDHEWTHNHQVNSPKFHLAWESETGWVQNEDGVWTNTRPDKAVSSISGASATDPQEDQASAIQIFRFDPSALSETRRNFIINNFPDWQPVIDYLENDSKY